MPFNCVLLCLIPDLTPSYKPHNSIMDGTNVSTTAPRTGPGGHLSLFLVIFLHSYIPLYRTLITDQLRGLCALLKYDLLDVWHPVTCPCFIPTSNTRSYAQILVDANKCLLKGKKKKNMLCMKYWSPVYSQNFSRLLPFNWRRGNLAPHALNSSYYLSPP